MDSLVASYASSEEEEDEERKESGRENRNSLSLPVNLPKPSTQPENPRKIFDFSSSLPKPKRIVRLTLPANPYLFKSHDEEEEEEEKDKETSKTRAKASEGSKPFGSNLKSLSSILPPPKNSLCLSLPTSSISSRRSTVESVAPVDISTNICQEPVNISNPEVEVAGKSSEYPIQNGETTNYADYGNFQDQWVDESSTIVSESTWGNDNYASYGDYTNYSSDYFQQPGAVEQEAPAIVENLARIGGKRRRNEIPLNIVEVKQDELMKNRPREDQTKLTGIAFGPSYQPAPSGKGKPSKLHKRKHQIGSLYHDMKQKEMELNERRARGFLTKAETHAKYGW